MLQLLKRLWKRLDMLDDDWLLARYGGRGAPPARPGDLPREPEGTGETPDDELPRSGVVMSRTASGEANALRRDARRVRAS